MSWLLLGIVVLAFGIGNVYALLAFNNLSEHGLQNMVRTFFWWPKIYAGREHFTDKGWRYRNVAVWLSVVAFLAFVMFAVRSCGAAAS